MFKCVKMLVGSENHPSIVYEKAKEGEVFQLGEALMRSSDVVTKANNVKPKYIACGKVENGLLPCYLVSDMVVFETTLSADPTDFILGDKLDLTSDACAVGIKSASGVAVIAKIGDDPKVGDKVHVIFE